MLRTALALLADLLRSLRLMLRPVQLNPTVLFVTVTPGLRAEVVDENLVEVILAFDRNPAV